MFLELMMLIVTRHRFSTLMYEIRKSKLREIEILLMKGDRKVSLVL